MYSDIKIIIGQLSMDRVLTIEKDCSIFNDYVLAISSEYSNEDDIITQFNSLYVKVKIELLNERKDGKSLIELAITHTRLNLAYELLKTAKELRIPLNCIKFFLLLSELIATTQHSVLDKTKITEIFQLLLPIVTQEKLVDQYVPLLNQAMSIKLNYLTKILLRCFFNNCFTVIKGISNKEIVDAHLLLSLQLNLCLDKKIIIEYYLAQFILNSNLDDNLSLSLYVIKKMKFNQEYMNKFILDIEKLHDSSGGDYDKLINLQVMRIICLIINFSFSLAANSLGSLAGQVTDMSIFISRFEAAYTFSLHQALKYNISILDKDIDLLHQAINCLPAVKAIKFGGDDDRALMDFVAVDAPAHAMPESLGM